MNKNKVTPLMLACQGGHLELVKCLLQSGAKLESRGMYSFLQLHCTY